MSGRLALSIFVLVAVASLLAVGTAYSDTPVNTQTVVAYTPTDEVFSNPERGFFYAKETHWDNNAPLDENVLLDYRQNKQITLIKRYFYLDSFVNSPISESYLAKMQTDFDRLRAAGQKAVIRFAYANTTMYPPYGDADKALVLAHLDQLAPVLQANSDVIAVAEAGFIGNWGEWFYTDHFVADPYNPGDITPDDYANRHEVLAKFLAVLPPSHTVQLRTPFYKYKVYDTLAGSPLLPVPLSAAEAHNGSDIARTGHHNDCFLGSDTDAGTYGVWVSVAEDKAYLAEETNYVPMGGEVCNPMADPPATHFTCAEALTELAQFHWSYLNVETGASGLEVYNGWDTGGCLPEIKQRLGYRLQLTQGTYDSVVTRGAGLNVHIELQNVGWAAPFNPRPVELVLRHIPSGALFTETLPADPRSWLAGNAYTIDHTFLVDTDMPLGDYELLLNLPDPAPVLSGRPEYAIRLANQNVWEATTGYNKLLHTVTVIGGPAVAGVPIAAFIAVPSYFYPGSLWTQMENAAPTVGLAIINPASGPGDAANPNYAAQVTHSQAAGITVIGYVHTSYGGRPASEVQTEIDTYYAYYPTLDGIFLDEVSTDCGLVDDPPAGNDYYSDLYAYIKAKGGKALAVINPGTQTNECYVAASDIIVNFEGTYNSYTTVYAQPDWVTAYNPSRFWHLVYDTPTVSAMRNALSLSKARHAGWVYVTPDLNTGEWLNPWDTLPDSPYWEAELNGVRPRNVVWMYGFGDPAWNSAERLDFLSSMGVNQVFLSLNVRKIDGAHPDYNASYTTALADLIVQARARGISIHAMTLQDPVFTYTEHHASGVALVQNVLAYNSVHPNAKLVGVHIDTEPHALPEWSGAIWSERDALLQQYVALLGDIRTALGPKGSTIEFSAAIGWWYNEEALAGNLPSGAATTLAQSLDVLVPMVYDGIGGSAVDIIGRASDEVQAAPTLIGIGASELGSYANVAATVDALAAQFVGAANYRGTSTFGYDRLPVWPIYGSNSADYLVNDRNRLSSTFGPRQKASEGYRYDWHRGIDIPADCNTPVHAIADGVVTKAGVLSGYEDRMVQIRHDKPGGGSYYSNYLHLTSVAVAVNDPVTTGQVIAASGETGIEDVNPTCDPDPAGGFDHLHFEIRDNGSWQEDAVHPFTRLAYPDLSAPQVAIAGVNVSNPSLPTVDVRVEVPASELDFNRLEVVLFNNTGGNPVEINRHAFDMQEWNALYTPHPSGTSDVTILDTAPAYDGVYDGDYGAGPVSPAPLGVTVRPDRYSYNPTTNTYRVDFTFTMNGSADATSYLVRAQVVDINGHYAADSVTVQIDITPPTISATATRADNSPYTADTWSDQSVTVHFICNDTGSGVASCPTDQIFNSDGVTPSVSGTATDNAGNSASAIFGPVQIDKSAPDTTITAQPTNPTASVDAIFEFSGSDASSGVAHFECSLDSGVFVPCTSPQTYSGLANGSHTFQVRAVDNANNVDATPAEAAWSIQTDSTPPVLLPIIIGMLGQNGWYVNDVSVSWSVTDEESAILNQSGCDSITISTDTAETTLVCTATSAGGTTTESASIKRDATAPTINGSPAPPPNEAGWSNGDVTVSFTCADSTSSVTACGPNLTLSGEGIGQTVTGTATDQAGNKATATVNNINIDRTAPAISASAAPAPNSAGWNNSDVMVSFTCTDEGGSGVASCSPNVTVTTEGDEQAVTGEALDVAGNSTTTPLHISLDKTPPTAAASISPAANAAGWHNSDVTISFSGTDGLSGLSECSTAVVLNSDGSGQSASGTCTDRAGNGSTPAAASNINIDKTDPDTQITGQPSNPSNLGDATFTFSGSDGGSGNAKLECSLDGNGFGDCSSGSISYNLLGSGTHTFAVRAVDVAGNTDATPAVYQWSVALLAPGIQAQVNGTQGSNGWYTSDVTLNWLIDGHGLVIDSSSGCGTQTVNSDTAHISFGCTATSQGGTTAASVTIQRDTIAPTISGSAAPAPNGTGWNNSDVTISFTCADTLSGVMTCGPNAVLSSEASGQSVVGTATDNAGNSATISVGNISIDKTAPTATASAAPLPNGAGWNNSDVTVSFSGSDTLSGIAGCTQPIVLGSDGVAQTASGVCTDSAGNVSATATVSGIKLDKTAPVVNVTGVVDGATYVLGSVPAAGCTTQDGLSDVATQAVLTLTGGNPQGQGEFTAACAGASDVAGNMGSASVTYWVGYSFNGFFQPVDNPPIVNSVKAGQAIPVKFSLTGDHGLDIFTQGFPASQQIGCAGGTPTSELIGTDTAGKSGLQYDSASGQYTYVWKSEKAWSGQCRQLVVRLKDGTDHTASFKFK